MEIDKKKEIENIFLDVLNQCKVSFKTTKSS